MEVEERLIEAAKRLSDFCDKAIPVLEKKTIVAHATNPLDYAWPHHEQYLSKWGSYGSKTLLLGMNPGPWGMAQTGIPFGSTEVARTSLEIKPHELVTPSNAHPKRPIIGLGMERQEISGQRLWGLLFEHYGSAESVFSNVFVLNHCPLLLLGETGKNLTPDNLPANIMKPILEACDNHLMKIIEILQIERIIGVGKYAEKRARLALNADKSGPGTTKSGREIEITSCWHPSPASPLSNRNGGADWRNNVKNCLNNGDFG
ncbi:MAG: single-stranded DNA-binding protein [Euryarchaeota archaeon TMED132]|nr:single-stranded DNA-binding protein [Euryarchaeota archaeon]RAH07801.1 MAG: single-stranded DNA-binding protein [Euryarchaeota archaeon TMED132]